MKRVLQKIAVIFQFSLIYYVAAGVILYFVYDVQRANMHRLNFLKTSAAVPIAYSKDQIPLDVVQMRRAIRYYKKLAESIPTLQKIQFIDLKFTYSRIYGIVGAAYYFLDEDKKAIEYFHKALELRPDLFWVQHNLGIVHYQQGDYSKAIKEFQEVIPNRIGTFRQFTSFDREIDGKVIDETRFRTVSKEAPVLCHIQSQKMLIFSYYKVGDYSKMLQLSQRAIRENFSDEGEFFYLYAGVAAYKLGQYKKSLAYFEMAQKENPDSKLAVGYFDSIVSALRQGEPPVIPVDEDINAAIEQQRFEMIFHPWTYVLPIGMEIRLLI